jgi:hypothetical protein
VDDKDYVPRPVRLADFLVIFVGFFHNIAQVFEVLFADFLELSVYHANRKTKVSRAWEQFQSDLETIQEETDGTTGFN